MMLLSDVYAGALRSARTGPMNEFHIDDLNLLRVLDAVLEDGSATAAARRLGMTQSAVSHALGRLRDQLGDPLVVRGGRGLVPTTRGEGLREPVRRALGELATALAPVRFDPATARVELRVSTVDYATVILLPGIVARVATEAPGVILVVVAGADPLPALEQGEADLAIGTPGPATEGMYGQRLFDDRFATVLRGGHPELDAPWDLGTFCRLRHVLIAPRGTAGGSVDPHLEALGRARRVVVRVPHFLAAAHVVAGSDAVCTLPERIARRVAPALGLVVRDPPLALPGFSIHQSWHARRHADPALRWLRRLIAEEAATHG